jgi:ribosomal protein S27AE
LISGPDIQNKRDAGEYLITRSDKSMKCPKCGSTDVSVQFITETQLKEQHHGIFWWLLIGWWWIPIKWIFFTIPALIVKIFAPKRYKMKTIHRKMAVCQNCGKSWQV